MQKEQFYNEIIGLLIKKKFSKQIFGQLKIKLSNKYKLGYIPTDIEIFLNAKDKDIDKINKLLLTKPTRTISGVSVCSLMAKPIACRHGRCTFCPGGPGSIFGNVPQSYTGKEPSTRRSIRNGYDPYLIVMNRIEQYIVSGHIPEKMEIIVQGGTFPSFPKSYQEEFIKYIFKSMNDFSKLFYYKNKLNFKKFREFFELPANIYDEERTKRVQNKLLIIKNIQINKSNIKKINKLLFNEKIDFIKNNLIDIKLISRTNNNNKIILENEQLRNETSKIRCVGLTIETKPDWGKLEHGNEMLKLGVTRIELGIQTIYDKVLKLTNRGHTIADSIESIRTLKDLGFKLNFHLMPGLPTVSKKMDMDSLMEIFTNPDFRPDMLKIYPCMVMKGTKLYEDFKKGKFKPLTTHEAAEMIAEFKKYVPYYTRIMRVQRDIPTNLTSAGVDRTNLRQYIEKITKERRISCKCIRCREPKQNKISKIRYYVEKYESSNGQDYFISAEDKERKTIYGFVRLRFPSKSLRKEITIDSALVRELHVYGQAASIGKKGQIQHKGIGKRLMKIAESIAKENRKNKIVVISGIGVREYFMMIGYKKEGPYMVKYV